MNDNFDSKYSEQISNDFEGQKFFINKLESDYIEFIKNWNDECQKYYSVFQNNVSDRRYIVRLINSILKIVKNCCRNKKKNLNSIHVNIVPEKVSTKSPLTILNGTWGSGKTHFLNELLVSIKKEKIKPKVIKKYVYIDSWKYLSSSNLVNDFIVELGKNLAPNNGIKLFNKRKMIKIIFNWVVIPNINKRFGLAIPLLKEENSISIINRNITCPTLIIIDNLERLGPSAWEIIRVIQKLSISTNLIFLLSIDKDKFNELCGFKKDGYEWNLRKYVSIPFYNLEPNYKNLLDSYNIPKKYNDEILKMLMSPNLGMHFTVREMEKILQQCEFNKSVNTHFSNKYILLSKFKKLLNKHNRNKIANIDDFERTISGVIFNDINVFLREYIMKLLKVNNDYYYYSNNVIWFDSNDLNKNRAEYRFFSTEFEKYIINLIIILENMKKSTLDQNLLLRLEKDISEIKNIVSNLRNDPDLREINNAFYAIYKKYYDKGNLSDDLINSYNSKYINETYEYLFNK